MTVALQTIGLSKSYGALQVSDNIDFVLESGARHALIGPNGAGKTTFVNLLTGRVKPSTGQVLLAGDEITSLNEGQRVKLGLGRTFQINSLFNRMTVLDNVCFGIAERLGVAKQVWKHAGVFKQVQDEAFEVLSLLGIADEADNIINQLPYGKQRLVEIAISLGLKPRVLLLDEPAAGVPTMESGRILEALDALPSDISILMIEHDMDLVFRFASRITVLVQGAVLCEGTPEEIANDARVRQVYLGEADE
jgi:ABC-type branched-subunit amino acid transport system ATPase component